MAAIDFPASPTVGQTFTSPNGTTYQWTGSIWIATAVATGIVALKTNVPGSLTIAQWGTYTIPWASLDFNLGGGGWNGSQYTVAVAGLYQVQVNLGLVWPSSGSVYVTQGEVYILVNGAIVHETSISHAAWQGPLYLSYPCSTIFQLAVGNTISFQLFSGNGVASFNGNKQWTFASIIRLGS